MGVGFLNLRKIPQNHFIQGLPLPSGYYEKPTQSTVNKTVTWLDYFDAINYFRTKYRMLRCPV